MAETDFAEIQRKHDEGDLTVEQAYRVGRTHAAYGWGLHYRPEDTNSTWSQELRESYCRGHKDYRDQKKLTD